MAEAKVVKLKVYCAVAYNGFVQCIRSEGMRWRIISDMAML